MQCKINTPFAKSLSDIKTEILEQTADKIHTRQHIFQRLSIGISCYR